ncbi:MAG TPA: MBL fold metallo-hydrolase [Candidatus Limnocylindrales bacterium]|nr:MBL fold metallo-hydrolase [Candidatus Limnocylindrales bacterium]
MQLAPFATLGLGDTSYLLAGEGEAVLVDPQRDAWRFVEAARQHGWRITHVLETHVHNDYVSGALETRAATGAEIVAPARGGYEFPIRGADEGESLEVGDMRLSALATPGHTPEHLAWLVHRADANPDEPPIAVFSGGSLLVGSVGRTDLLGPALTAALAADQQRSLRRLAGLPDTVAILPTHGAGSFCSAGPVGGRPTTTIGAERLMNPVFGSASLSEESFRERLLGGLGLYPAYYGQMAAINRRGPEVLNGAPRPPALDVPAFEATVAGGAAIVDGRDRASFAAGHVPGSLNVELNDSFASYVGWLLPFDAPIALVLPDPGPEALSEAVIQLLRIGYGHVDGWLSEGVDAWQAAGRPIDSYPIVAIREAAAGATADPTSTTVLDVRQPNEWRAGVIPGSRQIFVADLPSRLGELPKDRPVTVLCASGHRSSIAASVLDRAGFDVRLVAQGGAGNWPGPLERPAG